MGLQRHKKRSASGGINGLLWARSGQSQQMKADVQREDDGSATCAAKPPSCCCGSVSIRMLKLNKLHLAKPVSRPGLRELESILK